MRFFAYIDGDNGTSPEGTLAPLDNSQFERAIEPRRPGAISRADVADFLVRQINDRALIGTTPLLIS